MITHILLLSIFSFLSGQRLKFIGFQIIDSPYRKCIKLHYSFVDLHRLLCEFLSLVSVLYRYLHRFPSHRWLHRVRELKEILQHTLALVVLHHQDFARPFVVFFQVLDLLFHFLLVQL